MPVFQEHVLISRIISQGPSAQLPDNTTSAKDERLSSSTSYLPTYTLFYTEVDFIYLLKKNNNKKWIDKKQRTKHCISLGFVDFTYLEA